MAATIYLSLAQAVQTRIVGLELATLDPGQVLLQEFPTLREADGVAQPINCVLVTKAPASEQEVGTLTGSDDWTWPILVTHARASNQANGWDDVGQGWREAMMFAFHNKPLAVSGIPVTKCVVEPRVILDPSVWHDQNASVGQFIVRPLYRRART